MREELSRSGTENQKSYAEGYAEILAQMAEDERLYNEAVLEAARERREKDKIEDERALAEQKARIEAAQLAISLMYSNVSTITGAYFEYKKALYAGDEEKQKQIALQEFYINKALSIANVAINTADAIVGFLADPGGTYGLALSVAAGVTGAVQAALIAATPPPAFASGTMSYEVPSGFPNDSFPVARAESGERVTIETPAQQSGTREGPTIIEVHIGDAVYYPVLQRAFDNRKVYITERNIKR